MPRFYPSSDCDFYVERLVDNYHDANPHELRENPFKNPIRWFREPHHDDVNRSVICSWGMGKNFQLNTGFESDYFIKSRLRENCKLPTPGRRGMWKITCTEPARMCKLPLHEWKLEDWLKESRPTQEVTEVKQKKTKKEGKKDKKGAKKNKK